VHLNETWIRLSRRCGSLTTRGLLAWQACNLILAKYDVFPITSRDAYSPVPGGITWSSLPITSIVFLLWTSTSTATRPSHRRPSRLGEGRSDSPLCARLPPSYPRLHAGKHVTRLCKKMAAAAYQPAASNFTTYLSHSFGEDQHLLETSHRKRQGMPVLRNRSKTTSNVAPREHSYLPVGSSTGGIGESPRSSFSSNRFSQDRKPAGRVLNFNNGPRETTTPRTDALLRSQLPPTSYAPSPSHPIRVAVLPPAPKKREERDEMSSSDYVGNLFSPTRPMPPLHPYASARATVPPTPVPTRQPRRLAGSTSVPNLRQVSSFAKSEGRRAVNLVAETWCDALVFPRPRLKAHRLSITPPPTPLTPPSRSFLRHQDPNNPDVSATSSTDALFKAVIAGETRDVEKVRWNELATRSFQNSRSRSLSRSHYYQSKLSGTRRGQNTSGVKRGIEVLAESAFAQGTSSHTNTTTSTWTNSHSRNTSLATEIRKDSVSQQRTTPSETHSSVESHSHGRIRAISEGQTMTENPAHMHNKQSAPPRPFAPQPSALVRPPRGLPEVPAPHEARGGDRTGNDCEVGIAVTTINEPPSPLRLVGHPYATPDYIMSTSYRSHSRTPSASSPTYSEAAVRQRAPRREDPFSSGTLTDDYLRPDPERNGSRRNSYLGAHAYALTETDNSIIDFGEALQLSFKRSSGSSSSDRGHYVELPTQPTRTEKRPIPTRSAPRAMLRPPPPPVRYEPVKFEKHARQEQSRGLSPITDVTTPASSRSRSFGSQDVTQESHAPFQEPAQSQEDDIQDRSNESAPTIPTTESSPNSTQEPPLLDNSFDQAPYQDLFFRPSPSNSPDHDASQVSREASAAEKGEGSMAAVGKSEGLHPSAPPASHGLDIPESVGNDESEDSISAIGSEDELDFTLRQVQQRISITTISPGTPRPLSTHVPQEGIQQPAPLYAPRDLVVEEAPLSPFLTLPPDSSARDSSYSATSETSLGRITSSFPAPPVHSRNTTPSTLLEAYFTATDNTPARSRESVFDG